MRSTNMGSAKSTKCSSQKLMLPRSPSDRTISESGRLKSSDSICSCTSEAWFSSKRWNPEGQGTPVSVSLGTSCFKRSEVAGKHIWRAERNRSARVGDDRRSKSSKLRRWAFLCALTNSALFSWIRTGRVELGERHGCGAGCPSPRTGCWLRVFSLSVPVKSARGATMNISGAFGPGQ